MTTEGTVVGVPLDEFGKSDVRHRHIDRREKWYHQLAQLSPPTVRFLQRNVKPSISFPLNTQSTLYYLLHLVVLCSFVPVMSFLALSLSSPSSHSESPFPLFWKTTIPALRPFLPPTPSARVSNLQIAKL